MREVRDVCNKVWSMSRNGKLSEYFSTGAEGEAWYISSLVRGQKEDDKATKTRRGWMVLIKESERLKGGWME